MSESGSDTRSGIGARLRAGRERMGLTLLQAAEKLHVDPKVVESLEAERFDALGAAVFVRGHLKHYAELIGETPQQLVELYNEATKPAAPDLTKLPKAAPESRNSRMAVPSFVILIGFVLIGVVWWIVQSLPDFNEVPGAPESAVTIEPEIQLPEEPVESSQQPQTLAPAPEPTPAPVAEQPVAAAPVAAPAPPRTMEVTLRFASDSWVEIYDSKGERLFYDVGAADSERTVSGTPPFRVTFANAPGVSFNVNGKPATVPANLVNKDAAEFTISRTGRIVRPLPKADGG